MIISKELRMEFNKRFANGEQYIEYRNADYAPEDEDKIEEEHNAAIVGCDKRYYWEQQAVYNKILPIITFFDAKYKGKINKFIDYDSLIYGENGIVEKLIPLQREYNDIRNRKNEFIDRLSFGITFVEDGSVDLDELAEEGLGPGKIVVYRCGSQAPIITQPDTKPYEVYASELDRIERDIEKIRLDFQNYVLERWRDSY